MRTLWPSKDKIRWDTVTSVGALAVQILYLPWLKLNSCKNFEKEITKTLKTSTFLFWYCFVYSFVPAVHLQFLSLVVLFTWLYNLLSYWPPFFGTSITRGFYLCYYFSFLCEKPLRSLLLSFSFVTGATRAIPVLFALSFIVYSYEIKPSKM